MRRFSVFLLLCVIFILSCVEVFAVEEDEIGQVAGSDNFSAVSGSAVAPVVTGSDAALLSEINAQLQDITTPALLNVNGAQVSYFKSFLAIRPFCDYVITFDGQQDYMLYYGYDFANPVDYVRIFRVSTGGYNYEYRVATGKALVATSNIYIDSREGVNSFVEIEQIKLQTCMCIGFVVMLALWVLSRILFR